MQVSKDEAIKIIQEGLIEYLAREEGIDVDETGRKKFSCLNPEHNDRHPSMGVKRVNGKLKCHCFACRQSYDTLDLIGFRYGLTSFPDKVKKGCELFGINVDWSNGRYMSTKTKTKMHQKNHQPPAGPSSTGAKIKQDLTSYFNRCHEALVASGYAYTRKRGISDKLADAHNLGLDNHFTYATGGKVWQALIIPTSKASYTARNTNNSNHNSNDRVRKMGALSLFWAGSSSNSKKPVFIVEGEIDALSIEEVGGMAIGLGSTSNVNQLLALFDEMSKAGRKQEHPFVIALDNDDAGQKAAESLAHALYDRKIHPYRYDVYGSCKDANEALIADKAALQESVELAEVKQQEELEAQRREYQKNSAAGYLQDFIDGVSASVNTEYIPTGFSLLDKALDGGLYEGLYSIGAISSLGKTTLMQQITDQIAGSGHDVLIFSLEMARSELMAKSISRLTLLDVLEHDGDMKNAKTTRGITTGSRYAHYSQTEKDIINRAVEAYRKYASHVYIYEGLGDIGVNEIREKIKEHISSTGQAPVVLVDYLQILAPMDVRATDKQNTDKAVLELKRISRDFKIPVLAISSFNRINYNAAVSMEAFKESGAIEYSSDVLFALQFKGTGESHGKAKFDVKAARDKNPREIELYILKNRNGRTPRKPISFAYYPMFNYFKEEEIISDKDIPNNFTSVYDESEGLPL